MVAVSLGAGVDDEETLIIAVADGSTTCVGAVVAATVGATKGVTVGGMGVVSSATAKAARLLRLKKTTPAHSNTSQNAPNSSSTRRTRLRGTVFDLRDMG